MLIRTMDQLEAEGRIISISHGRATAVRLITKSDGLNFSISEARAQAAGQSDLWYKNHWEANYARSGNATLENRTTGERWELKPGVAVDRVGVPGRQHCGSGIDRRLGSIPG